MKLKKRLLIAIILTCLVLIFGVVICIFCFSEKPNKQQYTVTFLSDDGTVLKIAEVVKHGVANPPKEPVLSYGKIFTSWDKDISDITCDTTVKPIYEDITEKENVFALPGTYGKKGDVISIPLSLCGVVNISGFEIKLKYDTEQLVLDHISQEDGAVIYNDKIPSEIYINYVSAENTIGEVDLLLASFRVISEKGSLPVTIEVLKTYCVNDNEKLETCNYHTINSTIEVIDSKSGDRDG